MAKANIFDVIIEWMASHCEQVTKFAWLCMGGGVGGQYVLQIDSAWLFALVGLILQLVFKLAKLRSDEKDKRLRRDELKRHNMAMEVAAGGANHG